MKRKNLVGFLKYYFSIATESKNTLDSILIVNPKIQFASPNRKDFCVNF